MVATISLASDCIHTHISSHLVAICFRSFMNFFCSSVKSSAASMVVGACWTCRQGAHSGTTRARAVNGRMAVPAAPYHAGLVRTTAGAAASARGGAMSKLPELRASAKAAAAAPLATDRPAAAMLITGALASDATRGAPRRQRKEDAPGRDRPSAGASWANGVLSRAPSS